MLGAGRSQREWEGSCPEFLLFARPAVYPTGHHNFTQGSRLLTEAPCGPIRVPTGGAQSGRCLEVGEEGEACPEAALAWHHLCLLVMAAE